MKAADQAAAHPEDERLLHRLDSLQQEYDRKGGYTYKSEMNGILTSMAFGPEYHDKKIKSLSGGERTRLALAALLLEKPDLLILDEPTNHLDIGMLKWLEQYLSAYRGSMVIVSHDRYFLNRIPTRIPASGLENIVSILIKVGFSRSGETAPLIICIPFIKMAKPSIMFPIFRYTDLLQTIRSMIPITATTAEIVAVERILAIPPEPWI